MEIENEVKSTSELNVWESSTPTTPEIAPEIVDSTPEIAIDPKPESGSTPEPAHETIPPVTEKIVEVEKIVEKIVEKHPEFKDDYSKTLYEKLLGGDEDELYSYLSEKKKNFETMSDMDVVKEKIKKDNPSWSGKDIDSEIKFKYGKSLEYIDLDSIDVDVDPDKYEQAEKYNEDVDRRILLLERDARDSRSWLNENKKSIELPKIAKEEIQHPKQPTQEEIDELNQKWVDHVTQEMPKLSDFKFKIGDEEVTYKITDEDKVSQTEYMKDFNGQKIATDLGWIDENGNENVLKIAEDMLKLKNFEKILSSAGTQVKTSATKEVIAEIKNVDLAPKSSSPELSTSVAELLWQ